MNVYLGRYLITLEAIEKCREGKRRDCQTDKRGGGITISDATEVACLAIQYSDSLYTIYTMPSILPILANTLKYTSLETSGQAQDGNY